ncbi:bifunctional methylenetetrahydrofolate dehydrogenase/methenyltetrahydrofolate cyclohydrolase FolD [Aliamphritea spongicola]|uniref:bifunctional methylenetetrahydrofolate dehydrogenase/methenyltetrahydrofolate cyclohydrolase FolD n=1 Tax=Aliamphritea spongicola TaxID=707589 RepID=UPI00196B75B5|nr:bifunctional methylenetetrahydrofolate dehydrogenase/methenyltetrahydrofolate cyclohydrolase FolD [Aliamphritea spongicola]MBN3563112.1 bifunctional methylenetetrahydrofolate dehydrogenase/methenyltetrahydrofolate cyclohydrolase FolD [Aliamphritea spongicola]
MSNIIDGNAYATNLRQTMAGEVAELQQKAGKAPGLTVILVGEDPASQVYVRKKGEQAKEVGFVSTEHRLPATTSQEELLALVDQLNNDNDVHGILCQLPLPSQIDEKTVLNAIDPDKDVDGFHPVNVGRLSIGEESLLPCTPHGSVHLIKHALGDNLSGKNAVVIGRSNIVGKPMAALLLAESCTVTIVHSRTQNIEEICRQADIVVAAVGRPEMVNADWIKEGACVIDVGINRIERDGKNKLVGDVDFASASEKAAHITPVPGGVGPMTIAMLLLNTLTAFKRLENLN